MDMGFGFVAYLPVHTRIKRERKKEVIKIEHPNPRYRKLEFSI